MWVQSDPSLLCGQEAFIKSGPPTLPAKQIQIDQIVLNLVTHYGFKAAGARKGAQNSSSFLDRSYGKKIHLNRRVGVAFHFNQVAGGSLADSLCFFFLDKTLTCPLSGVARETTWYELPESKSQKILAPDSMKAPSRNVFLTPAFGAALVAAEGLAAVVLPELPAVPVVTVAVAS